MRSGQKQRCYVERGSRPENEGWALFVWGTHMWKSIGRTFENPDTDDQFLIHLRDHITREWRVIYQRYGLIVLERDESDGPVRRVWTTDRDFNPYQGWALKEML
jgi:hypothetical protein